MLSMKKKADTTIPSSIQLIEGKGRKSSGAEFYWHIYSDNIHAGQVYINFVDDPILGKHHSIHIFLNKKNPSFLKDF